MKWLIVSILTLSSVAYAADGLKYSEADFVKKFLLK